MKSFKEFLGEGKKAKEMQRLIDAHRLAANTVGTEIQVNNPPILTPQEVLKQSGKNAVRNDIKERKRRMSHLCSFVSLRPGDGERWTFALHLALANHPLLQGVMCYDSLKLLSLA